MTKILPLLILTLLLIASCQTSPTTIDSKAEAASRVARSMIGQPYRYGGQSPGGFDCSGLVWYSYKKVGVKTPRTSKSLRKKAKKISRNKLQAGDLLFFKGWVRTGHVGIYIGDGRFVHAPSSGKKVKIDRLDKGYWDDHFKSAGRIRY